MSSSNVGTYPLSLNLKIRPRLTEPGREDVMTVAVEYDGLSCEFLDEMFKHYKEAGTEKDVLEAVKVLNGAKELKDIDDASEEEVMEFLLNNGFYICELELAATFDNYEQTEDDDLITASTLTMIIDYLQEAVDFFKEHGVEDEDDAINVYVQYHTEYEGHFLANVIEQNSAKSPKDLCIAFKGVYQSTEDYAYEWTKEQMGEEAFDAIPSEVEGAIDWDSVWDSLTGADAQVVLYGGKSYIFHWE